MPLAPTRAPADIPAPATIAEAPPGVGDDRVPVGPDHDAIARVQKVRKAILLVAILGMIVLGVFADTRRAWGPAGDILALASLGAIGAAIIGRAWCSLYIGGRKKAEIVDLGPYSLSRNPLYAFSFIGAFGMGAQSGSLVLAVAFLLVAVLVFRLTVHKEEVWLGAAFGETYAAYAARTPRFWPRFSGWKDAETLEVRPAYFLRTLWDASAMLLAIPLFAGLALLRDAEVLPTLLRLP